MEFRYGVLQLLLPHPRHASTIPCTTIQSKVITLSCLSAGCSTAQPFKECLLWEAKNKRKKNNAIPATPVVMVSDHLF